MQKLLLFAFVFTLVFACQTKEKPNNTVEETPSTPEVVADEWEKTLHYQNVG